MDANAVYAGIGIGAGIVTSWFFGRYYYKKSQKKSRIRKASSRQKRPTAPKKKESLGALSAKYVIESSSPNDPINARREEYGLGSKILGAVFGEKFLSDFGDELLNNKRKGRQTDSL